MISSIKHKQSISWTFLNDAIAISAREMPKNHTDKEPFASTSSCIQIGILTLLFPRKRRCSSPSPFISHCVLQYHGLLSAISCQWKKHLKQEQQAATVNLPEIDMLTCKTIYKSLIDCQNFPPPTAEKRLIECGFDIHERQKIYSSPFLVTKEIKLSIFQYKIIYNILYTNCILY